MAGNMELDEAYQNGAFIAGAAAYPPRWTETAAAFRERGLIEQDVPYGGGAREVYDLFHPARLARGLVMFVHGGYWKAFDKSSWSHLAAGAVARGWAVAMPSYPLAPDVRVSQITASVRACLVHAAARVPGPIVLVGHSAGGHLVGRMICPDQRIDGVSDRITRVMPISPVADLRPLEQTSMWAELRLDEAEAHSESLVLAQPSAAQVRVVVGGNERPAFIEQARGLGRAWQAPVEVKLELHHFDVFDGLADPDSAIMASLLG